MIRRIMVTGIVSAMFLGSAAFAPDDSAKKPVVPNYSLNQAALHGPQALQELIRAHLAVFPNSFPHRDIFYMPYLDSMVWKQEDLRRKLARMPRYAADMEARGPFVDLVIRAKQDYELEANAFNREVLDRWQQTLRDLVFPWPADKTLGKLKKAIVKDAPQYLRESRWKTWLYDNKEDREFEEKVVALVMLAGMTGKGANLEPLKQGVKLEEGHIDYLAEEKLWKAVLEEVAVDLDERFQTRFRAESKTIMEKWERGLRNQRGYAMDKRKFSVKKGETVHVYEVHPDLAVMRGFVGNDCATDVSFGFPYSPFERVYYVANEKLGFLGYISVSIVEFRGKRSLFFHTIAGPHIDHAISDLIIRGFFQAREQLGGELMTMPEEHRIYENINFRPIEAMMSKYASASKAEKVKWLDVDYRRVIVDTGSSPFYDDPERNHSARLIQVASDDLEVKVTMRPFASPLGAAGAAHCVSVVAGEVLAAAQSVVTHGGNRGGDSDYSSDRGYSYYDRY